MNIAARVAPGVIGYEIDLFNVFRIIWRRKLIILIGALLGVGVGAGYAYLVRPEYEVSTTLHPVALNDLDALNRSGVYSLPPEKALNRLGASLGSYETRLNFFLSRPDLIGVYMDSGQSIEQAFNSFNSDALKLTRSNPKGSDGFSDFITMSFRYIGRLDGAAVLNDLIRYAIEHERLQLTQDFKVIVSNRLSEVELKLSSSLKGYEAKKESNIARLLEEDSIKRAQLQDELRALRVQLRLQREARLAQLAEAISIASSLGMKKPFTPSAMAIDSLSTGPIIRAEVNNQQLPLYFMGVEVLQAEQSALRKRVSDDFTEPRVAQIRKELIMLASNRKVERLKARENEAVFLDGIDSLRTERARLMGVNTDLSQLSLVRIDQPAMAPSQPIKPRKGLILVIGFLVGVMLGMSVAFVREVFKVRLRQMQGGGEGSASLRGTVVSSQGVKYESERF